MPKMHCGVGPSPSIPDVSHRFRASTKALSNRHTLPFHSRLGRLQARLKSARVSESQLALVNIYRLRRSEDQADALDTLSVQHRRFQYNSAFDRILVALYSVRHLGF